MPKISTDADGTIRDEQGRICGTWRDISWQTYGKYTQCTKAPDGLWYSDLDMNGSAPKKGALPSPRQDTPKLTSLSNRMHEERATATLNSALASSKRGPFHVIKSWLRHWNWRR